MLTEYKIFHGELSSLKDEKILITTINAHSFNISKKDIFYKEALINSDALLPDGISIVKAIKFLTGYKLKKIAGADLFLYEMNRLQKNGGKCFFLGSSDRTLQKIINKSSIEFPNIKIKAYSPPYKTDFSQEENIEMLKQINAFEPDVLMIGMTAPKQEKWAYLQYKYLNVKHICCIGAVFDFYAGTVKRAPDFIVKIGFEWFYRLVKEPKRLWRRYLIGNAKFIWYIILEKIYIIKRT